MLELKNRTQNSTKEIEVSLEMHVGALGGEKSGYRNDKTQLLAGTRCAVFSKGWRLRNNAGLVPPVLDLWVRIAWNAIERRERGAWRRRPDDVG